MSRIVPMEQALEDDDRRYLRSLGASGASIEARLDEAYPPDPAKLAKFDAEQRKAAAVLHGEGLTATEQTALEDENARLRAELAALRGETPPDEPVDYGTLSKAELEAEIDRINAEDPEAKLVKGKVDEMRAALATYFAE